MQYCQRCTIIVYKLFQACSHLRIWESTAGIIKQFTEIKKKKSIVLDSEIAIDLKIHCFVET